VHMVWNAYEPHFIGDGHEMGRVMPTTVTNGAVSNNGNWFGFDMGTLFTSNPNTPEELCILAHDGILNVIDPNDPATFETADSLEHLLKRALRDAGLEWWTFVGTSFHGEEPHKIGANPYDFHDGNNWILAGTIDNYVLAHSGYQEGNPEEGITDVAARLKGAFGLLTEATNFLAGRTLNMNRRIQAQEITWEAMLRAFAHEERGPILRNAVDRARVAMATGTSVRAQVSPEDLVVAIQNQLPVCATIAKPGETGVPRVRLLRNPALNPGDPDWDTPVAVKDFMPIRVSRSRQVIALPEEDREFSTVRRPTAYIISADAAAAARIIFTGVEMRRLTEPVEVEVEYYAVREFGENVNFRGAFNVPVAQLLTGITSVTRGTRTVTFPKDTIVFFMDQYNSVHASLTVEPSAGRNFGNYWFNRAKHSREGFLPVRLNQDFPVYRFMGDASELGDTYFTGHISMLPFVIGTHIEWPLLLTRGQKRKYYIGVLREGLHNEADELLKFKSFIVNRFTGNFSAYLRNTERPGQWYAWNWRRARAERIFADGDGFAQLTADNIGCNNEVIMFCVAR